MNKQQFGLFNNFIFFIFIVSVAVFGCSSEEEGKGNVFQDIIENNNNKKIIFQELLFNVPTGKYFKATLNLDGKKLKDKELIEFKDLEEFTIDVPGFVATALPCPGNKDDGSLMCIVSDQMKTFKTPFVYYDRKNNTTFKIDGSYDPVSIDEKIYYIRNSIVFEYNRRTKKTSEIVKGVSGIGKNMNNLVAFMQVGNVVEFKGNNAKNINSTKGIVTGVSNVSDDKIVFYHRKNEYAKGDVMLYEMKSNKIYTIGKYWPQVKAIYISNMEP